MKGPSDMKMNDALQGSGSYPDNLSVKLALSTMLTDPGGLLQSV